MEQCVSSHKECRSTTEWLPTRLLDLSQDKVRLALRAEIPSSTNYMTLSHCWGSIEFFKLSTNTFDQLRNGISLDMLPLSFQQAISVTRAFQIRYLWIDALCIIQHGDDLQDWSKEAMTMDKVYSKSYLNILASAAPDSAAGIFYDRKSDDIRSCQITLPKGSRWNINTAMTYMLSHRDFLTSHFQYEPIHKRGWVVQERLLSPRILHFCTGQLFWECRQALLCETYPTVLEMKTHENNLPYFKETIQNAISPEDSEDRTSWDHAWRWLVAIYSRCFLTYPSDKLTALSGIVKTMQQKTTDEYLVGFWKRTLVRDLAWTVSGIYVPVNRPFEYRAPTWSWLSLDGSIDLPFVGEGDKLSFLTKIIDIQITYHRSDITGPVVSGFLILCGPLSSLTATRGQDGCQLYTDRPIIAPGCVPDLANTDLQRLSEEKKLFCLHLYDEIDDSLNRFLLLLRCVDPSRGMYERAGCVSFLDIETAKTQSPPNTREMGKKWYLNIPHHEIDQDTGWPIIVLR